MHITLDSSLLFRENIGTNGLDTKQLQSLQDIKAYEAVTSQMLSGKYGFINILNTPQHLKDCQSLFKQQRSWKTLIVVGIGGSDLGARMLQEALQADQPVMKVVFVGDTTDPEQYIQLFHHIDLKTTLVNVISKSGSTTETAVAYLLLKQKLQEAVGEQWFQHFIFTTDQKKGILKAEADRYHIPTLDIPDDVGGRFSVLTSVGIFPALAMGIDMDQVLGGAYQTAEKIKLAPMQQNMAWHIALTQYLLQKEHHIDTVVFMPYIWRLSLFANWFRQLWAESLGKDGKGILPIKAVGPADQHSQLQFYAQGKWLSSFCFITAKHYPADLVITNENIKELDHLHTVPVDDVIRFEWESTQISLANHGRPSMSLILDCLDNAHVGGLIVLFELAVVYLAELLQVNAFDQPGVEESKEYLYGLLGKAEYAHKVEDLQEKKNRLTVQTLEL